MMEKTMVTYSLSGKKNALELTRKIYGYIDSSNHGKYKYERPGILTEIDYEKVGNGVFFINPVDLNKITTEFKKINLKIKVYNLIIKT